jgi:segregation and condensation protein B
MQRFYDRPSPLPLRRDPRRLPQDHPPRLVHRLFAEARGEEAPQGDLARDATLALVEAALLSADEPLTPKRLATVCGLADGTEARRLVKKLQTLYDRDGTAFQVQELAGGFQLLTRPEFHPWLARLRRTGHDLRLSAAMRETLAIIAYRQPIMRADVETIRGVHCGELLGQLMEKGLVRVAGRDNSLGRPMLYGTTKKFLQMYGLRSLKDLPQVEQLKPPQGKAAEGDEEGA